MFRIWTNLGIPFGEDYLPKKMLWQYDDLGIPLLDVKPEYVEYWEFNTAEEANEWIDVFYDKRMSEHKWVPAKNQFRVIDMDNS